MCIRDRNRNIEGKTVALIKLLNQLSFPKISIDIPSGFFADKILDENSTVFKADETLSFQFWKKSFLHPETGVFGGNINIFDIGLGKEFIQKEPSENFVIDETLIRNIYKPVSYTHLDVYKRQTYRCFAPHSKSLSFSTDLSRLRRFFQ